MSRITDALNVIMNAKRAGKSTCEVPASKLLINVLNIMKKHGYIDYKIVKEKLNIAEIEILKVNECRGISPKYYATMREIDKYVKRFLPARDFGIIIISTSRGLLTHREAIEKKAGGSLIAYCF